MRLLKIMSGTVVTNLDGCVNQAFMLLFAAGLLCVFTGQVYSSSSSKMLQNAGRYYTCAYIIPTAACVSNIEFKISLLVCEALSGLGPKYTCTV